MKALAIIFMCFTLTLLLIIPTLTQTQIALNDRSFVAALENDSTSILKIEEFPVSITQSVGNIQMLSIRNNLPESVAVTVDAGTPAFVEDITVNPAVLSLGETCSVILDYDASNTQLGQYSLNIVIKANGINSYIVLYRQVEIAVVATSFYAEGLGGAFTSPFTVGSATLVSNGEEIVLTVKDKSLMWAITDCEVKTGLNPQILEVLDHFSQTEWYNKMVQKMGQPETWTTQTYTGENGGDTIKVKIFNGKYVFSYSKNEGVFTSFFIGKL